MTPVEEFDVTNSRRSHGAGHSSVAALDRALEVLLVLANGSAPRSVTGLARELGIPKGSMHRILSTLKARGLVQQDSRTQRYDLGWAALRLGSVYLARADITGLALPVLEELSAITQETSTLSVRVGRWQRTYVAQVRPDREVRMAVSIVEPYPLHAGGSGRALLAFLPAREQESYLSALERGHIPSAELPEPAESRVLRSQLEEVRGVGWTHSVGDHMPGAASVASPVLGHTNEPVAAISVCGPADRFNPLVNSHVVHLLDAVEALSVQLGREE